MKKNIFYFLSFALLTLGACSSDDDTTPEVPSVGATIPASVGGANQPNQLYLDLSTGESKSINRQSWDFGFSSGSDFRVVINGSLKMAVKKIIDF
ncbi:HmuY family protein [Flavobacterium sp. CGRL2]